MHHFLEKFLFLGLFVPLMASCTHDGPMFSGDLIFVEGMSAGIQVECRPNMDQAIMGSTGAMVQWALSRDATTAFSSSMLRPRPE
jgi:hypothetical protein